MARRDRRKVRGSFSEADVPEFAPDDQRDGFGITLVLVLVGGLGLLAWAHRRRRRAEEQRYMVQE